MNKKIAQSAETRRTLHTHTHTHTGSFFLSLLSTMFVVSGAFATGVSSTATTADCDKPTLNTYTGTSNLQAGWEPNPIALHWYSDGEELNNIPTASQSCIYDSTLTPPPAPTKTGYTFKGWRVKQAAGCSLSGLDPSISADYDATHMRWKPLVADGYTMVNAFGTENSSDLNPGEWAVTFSYGTVKGIAKCSAKKGKNNSSTWSAPSSNWSATESELTSASGTARYCWCSATNYTPNGGNQCNLASPSWVFYDDKGYEDECADGCAYVCAHGVRSRNNFRPAVFGVQ